MAATVIAEGTPEEVMQNSASLTGQYLSGFRQIPIPKQRREPQEHRQPLADASRAPRPTTCRTSPPASRSAPSPASPACRAAASRTLIVETLYKALAKRLNDAREHAGEHAGLEGVGHLDKIVDIDQSPIGRTPRSNPATYTGAFSPIRDWFSQLPESTERGYKPGRFSFNVKGGRCEACQGDGVMKIEMHFLPDVYVQCDVCKGKRYNRETLEILFRGKSIADVLDMTVDEGCEFFKAVPVIRDKLLTLQQVGLGYIHIGQQATTLSGGEAQRVKLAKELSRRATGRTLYILDEPTTGLHFEDVRKLLEVLHRLVETGNTVLVIEHNLEVIKTADWVLDLGPDGGTGGGRMVAEGPPEEIVKVARQLHRPVPRPPAAAQRRGGQEAGLGHDPRACCRTAGSLRAGPGGIRPGARGGEQAVRQGDSGGCARRGAQPDQHDVQRRLHRTADQALRIRRASSPRPCRRRRPRGRARRSSISAPRERFTSGIPATPRS